MVPTSRASPWSGPAASASGSPSSSTKRPSRVTAGSSRRRLSSSPSVPVSIRSAPRRSVWQRTSPERREPRAAGEAEAALEVPLLGRGRREQLAPRLHLHQALAALALLHARGGHVDAERLGAIEERLAGRELARAPSIVSVPRASGARETAELTSPAAPAGACGRPARVLLRDQPLEQLDRARRVGGVAVRRRSASRSRSSPAPRPRTAARRRARPP